MTFLYMLFFAFLFVLGAEIVRRDALKEGMGRRAAWLSGLFVSSLSTGAAIFVTLSLM